MAIDQVEQRDVAHRYGLVFVMPEPARHPGISSANGDKSWELPIPATFVMSQVGTIELAFVDPDWTHRLEPTKLLNALEGIATKGIVLDAGCEADATTRLE